MVEKGITVDNRNYIVLLPGIGVVDDVYDRNRRDDMLFENWPAGGIPRLMEIVGVLIGEDFQHRLTEFSLIFISDIGLPEFLVFR